MNLNKNGTKSIKSNFLKHEGVGIENGVYGRWKKEKDGQKFIPCGGAVLVTKVITDIDTYEQSLEIAFKNAQGVTVTKRVTRGELIDPKILQLGKYGVQVSKNSVDTLVKTLDNQMEECETVSSHAVLGFSDYQGMEIFKGFHGVNMDSTYSGDANIEPKGSLDVWNTMIREEVSGHTPMEFILASSVSGVLVDYIKRSYQVENVIIHCIGESSSGKSTCALLGVSAGASPDLAGNSFAFDFNDTVNSLMRSIPCSFPTLIDEGSLLDSKDLTNMMYSISGGREKKRLSKELKVQDNAKFHTVIYITSEKSLLKQCKQNSGLIVRNIEFQGVQWTKSAEQSDKIKGVINENYGHLLPLFAKTLMDVGKEQLLIELKNISSALVSRAKEIKLYNEFTERISKQLAIIVESACILRDRLDYDLDVDKIIDFMLEATSEKVESMGDRALNWLASWVTKNHNNLIIAGDMEFTGTCKGRINSISQTDIEKNVYAKNQLLIDKESFIDMMAEGGFDNTDIVLKELRNRGYLDSPKDRYLSNINIVNETKTKGYKIYIPIDETEQPKMKTRNKFKKMEEL